MFLDFTPLRISRDYRLLFFGQLVSFFGSMMSFVILPWQMYQLTQSNAMVGYIYLFEFVPMLLLAFVGGALADAFDKRRLLRFTEVGQTLVTLLLLLNAHSATPSIALLYASAALHAGLAAIQRPAYEALMQRILPAEVMPAVASLNTLRFNFGAILGPSIAGFIVGQYSPQTVYALDLGTFLASLAAVFMISAVPAPVNPDRPGLRSVIDGIRYAFGRQDLIGTYLIDIFAMFFAFPAALYPALAAQYGDRFLGLFPAALATGMLIGNLTSRWTNGVNRHGLWVVIGALVWGVGIIFFGLATDPWLALFFLAAAGFGDMISGLFRMTIWNQTIPNHLRGRLAALEMISYLTGPMLGGGKMGIVAERFGVREAIVSGGVLCVVSVVIAAAFLPKFLSYDGRAGRMQREFEENARANAAVSE